jgi:hypothetical protein
VAAEDVLVLAALCWVWREPGRELAGLDMICMDREPTIDDASDDVLDELVVVASLELLTSEARDFWRRLPQLTSEETTYGGSSTGGGLPSVGNLG